MAKISTRALQAQLRTQLAVEAAYGAWCVAATTSSIELMAQAHFEWVGVDLQHSSAGPFGSASLYDQVLAADAWNIPIVVRAPWPEPGAIMQILDAGASAVIVPMVNSPEEAARVASWVRYPPEGVRSLGTVRSALADGDFSPALANESVLCFVMIETAEAAARAEEILSTPGVDGVYVGPWDLTLSVTGKVRSEETAPVVEPIILRILEIAKSLGVIPGIATANVEEAALRNRQGFRLITATSDLGSQIQGATADRRHLTTPQ